MAFDFNSNSAVKTRFPWKKYLPWAILAVVILAAAVFLVTLLTDNPDEPAEPELTPAPASPTPVPTATPIPFAEDSSVDVIRAAAFERSGLHRDGFPLLRWEDEKFYIAADGRTYYNDSSVKTLTGIDVSEHQYDIDWAQVAEAGIDFAMIRMGYRGSTAGGLYEDEYFRQNMEGALSNGIGVGVYFYSQAISEEEALEEAEFLLDAIAGYDVDFPVVFDWEIVGGADARTYTVRRDTLNACAKLFCEKVEQAGYDPMVYFTQYLGYRKYELRDLSNYGFWYAEYEPRPNFVYDFDMWQYTCWGSVPGVEGDVDLNLYFVP